MNQKEMWLEDVEWIEDDNIVDELLSTTLVAVPDDTEDAASEGHG